MRKLLIKLIDRWRHRIYNNKDDQKELDEIVPWLKKLCEKSGGYDEDWRYLAASMDGCGGWDIKYIRFVHHDSGRFMVCNAYWHPIKWRKVLDNINKIED